MDRSNDVLAAISGQAATVEQLTDKLADANEGSSKLIVEGAHPGREGGANGSDDVLDALAAHAETIRRLTERADEAKEERNRLLVEGAQLGHEGITLESSSGLSRSAVHRVLSRAGVTLNPVVHYTTLALTAIVTASAEPLPDGRGPVSLGSTAVEIAERSLTSWPLDKIRREGVPVRQLIVRLGDKTETPGRIAAVWALDPDEPTRDDAFRPLNVQAGKNSSWVGRRLSMQGERLGTLVTWSRDIRHFHASGGTQWAPTVLGR